MATKEVINMNTAALLSVKSAINSCNCSYILYVLIGVVLKKYNWILN